MARDSRIGVTGGGGAALIKSSVKSGAKILGPAAVGSGIAIKASGEDKRLSKLIEQQKKDKAFMEKVKAKAKAKASPSAKPTATTKPKPTATAKPKPMTEAQKQAKALDALQKKRADVAKKTGVRPNYGTN
jgi:hypothetical protein